MIIVELLAFGVVFLCVRWLFDWLTPGFQERDQYEGDEI